MQQYQDENPPGAVGGEGKINCSDYYIYSFHSKTSYSCVIGFVGKVSEQEERVAEQARLLLERY